VNNAGRIQRSVAWFAAHDTSALPLTLLFAMACLGAGGWADNLGASGALVIWLLAVIGAGTALSAMSFVVWLVVVRSDLLVPRVRVVTRVRLARGSAETPPCSAPSQGHSQP
jgi:hypothetical protein